MSDKQRYTGLVEKWFDDRGFGFIRRDGDAGPSIFINARDITSGHGHRILVVGQAVEFGIKQTDRGPRCIDVLLEEAAEDCATAALGASAGAG